jgi:hypothetical protein
MNLTKTEKKLLWNLLFSLRNCFNNDGTLCDGYYENVVLADLTKGEKEIFNDLINNRLLRAEA